MQSKIFRKPKAPKVLDEMTGALHISEKFPKITTEYLWHKEDVYGVGDHLATRKLGLDEMPKRCHLGVIQKWPWQKDMGLIF